MSGREGGIAKYRAKASGSFGRGKVEEGMGHLQVLANIYDLLDEWGKAAEIFEERASRMLALGNTRGERIYYTYAQGDYRSAARRWRDHGDALAKEGKKAEAMDAYLKRGLLVWLPEQAASTETALKRLSGSFNNLLDAHLAVQRTAS